MLGGFLKLSLLYSCSSTAQCCWQRVYTENPGESYISSSLMPVLENTDSKTSSQPTGGTYFVKVYNKKNQGHYSLAIGEAESFGDNLWEQILTWTPILFYIGPYMDIIHWQKFDVRAYLPHIILLVLIFVVYFILNKLILRKK